MGIQQRPAQPPLVPVPPSWGELAPDGQLSRVVRFYLQDRVVTFPISEFRKWEHLAGDPEILKINTPVECIFIEGATLGPIRAALDLGRLVELRSNSSVNLPRPGPRIYSIQLERND